ncbi:MAG: hypothetical protein HY426_03875 [Candidatus Levybacteria bacterium]|nr:hypothetical protein [Candidatus Levybacteria bacterium]
MKIAAQKWLIANSLWRIVLVFVLLATGYLLLTGQVHAQTSASTTVGSQSSATQYPPNLNPDVPRDQHTYVQSTMIELMASMVCQLSGIDMIRRGQRCLGIDQQTGKIGFVENGNGAIGVIGTFIAYTFTPPISSGQYVNYLAGNFGLTKSAYAETSPCAGAAQGVGFCGIRPLLSIWVAMRNIAYLLFVLIFVLIGLAIMLRVHIDPRTVMTIENQIPRIIVGILLVTFSFAIAGFLVDVMYVAIYLVGGVLFDLIKRPAESTIGFNDIATSPTPFDLVNRLWPGKQETGVFQEFIGGVHGGFPELASQGSDTIKRLVESALNGSPSGQPDFKFEPGLFDAIGNIFTFLVGLIVGLLAALIIFLGLIYALIRLWVILIVAYINVLLDIIFAPFWFLIGLFPGSTVGVGAWFKDMIANLAVFPTALSMIIIGKLLSQVAANPAAFGATSPIFIPPLVGGGTGAGSDVFSGIIALGFLLLTPNVLTITRGAVKATGVNYGPVFKPLGIGPKAVVGTYGTVMAGLQLKYYANMFGKTPPPQVQGPPPAGGGGGR